MGAVGREQKNAAEDVEANGSLQVRPERGPGGEVQRNARNAAVNAEGRGGDGAPEKKITLLALRLAFLEKIASRAGALGFVWATVVLLGGFASTLSKTDFWVVTSILIVQGARVFCRSHELEWQLQTWWSFPEFPCIYGDGEPISSGARPAAISPHRRTWETRAVPLLPGVPTTFQVSIIRAFLSSVPMISTVACAGLPLWRLIKHDYGEVEGGSVHLPNLKGALDVFYWTALVETALCLLEKLYWIFKISFQRLLQRVSKECGFGPAGPVYIRRLFFDSYSKCINGSIFDGLKIDLFSFANKLLVSDSDDERQMGAEMLNELAKNEKSSAETLRKVGTSEGVTERLLAMLSWKNPADAQVRRAAAEIVSKLAGESQNALRVAGIPGAMESIGSLLERRQDTEDLNSLGLQILKKIASDDDSYDKILNTRGLLLKIADFIGDGVERRRLATHGERHGEQYRMLQELAVDICTILESRKELEA